MAVYRNDSPDSKIHGANMGPIWGRQDPGGPHVGFMNFAIWVELKWWGYYGFGWPFLVRYFDVETHVNKKVFSNLVSWLARNIAAGQ